MSQRDPGDIPVEWTPPHPGPSHDVDPGAIDKVPSAVAAEEAFLDAVVSHVDEDESGLEQLRDKVSQWYESSDAEVGPPVVATADQVAADPRNDQVDPPGDHPQ
ncbi:MAG: hypothetical protein FWD75_10865 [Propionibacteriaceae bacterium]|nr:hypothetical protein [Propionibacteriaceae bacterium]